MYWITANSLTSLMVGTILAHNEGVRVLRTTRDSSRERIRHVVSIVRHVSVSIEYPERIYVSFAGNSREDYIAHQEYPADEILMTEDRYIVAALMPNEDDNGMVFDVPGSLIKFDELVTLAPFVGLRRALELCGATGAEERLW